MFFVASIGALVAPRRFLGRAATGLLILFFSLFIGLRHEVGGDWFIYLENLQSIDHTSFQSSVIDNLINDPGYNFFSWISVSLGAGIYGVNLICAVLFSVGLIFFCRAQPRPWLALVVSIPYLVIVVGMGYTKQSVALGLFMPACLFLGNQKIVRFSILIFIASLFHKTAVILMIAALPSLLARNTFIGKLTSFLVIASSSLGAFYLFLAPKLDFLIYGYEDQAMQSQGAGIRVAMVFIPGVMMILFSGRDTSLGSLRNLWLGLSYAALGCAVLLLLIKSSTLVDRLALYCIPLQLVVATRIHDWRLVNIRKTYLNLLVIILFGMVQFVWLNYALTASAWYPYKNILFL